MLRSLTLLPQMRTRAHRRFAENKYDSVNALAEDFRLMFKNAHTFNEEGYVH